MTFVPAIDCDNYTILSGLEPWNGLWHLKKMLYPYITEPKSSDEFRLVIHIFIRTDDAGEFGLFRAKLFCFEISLPLFSVAGMYEVPWRRMMVKWHSPLGFSCYTFSSSLREIRECRKCTSEGEPQSGPILWFTCQNLISKDTIQCARNEFGRV